MSMTTFEEHSHYEIYKSESALPESREWDLPFSTGPMVPMTVLTPFSLWNFSNSFLCFATLDSPPTVFCLGLLLLQLPREWGRGDTKREGWNR